jgi:hypothetical protein
MKEKVTVVDEMWTEKISAVQLLAFIMKNYCYQNNLFQKNLL